MKFKRLSSNTLEILLNYNEIPNQDDEKSKNLDKLMSDTSYAREAFLCILNKAENDIGFVTRDYKIKINARALYNGNFILVVTRLMQMKNNKIVVHPKKIIKDDLLKKNYHIYSFNSFDDFCDFCSFLKKNNITNYKKLSHSVKLYLFNGIYFFTLYQVNPNYKKISAFNTIITEFSKYYSSQDLFMATLEEKGRLVLDNNAVEVCQKYF